MVIRLSAWKEDLDKLIIVYPIRAVPTLPATVSSFNINCQSTLIQWLEEFVKLYGTESFIKLKVYPEFSMMRIYNEKYLEDTFKVAQSVERFGGSLD